MSWPPGQKLPPARPARETRHAHTRVFGERVYHNVRGDGPPLVLLHGWASSGQLWRYVVDDLATRHRVYALDLPGCGLSGAARCLRLADSAAFLDAWMAAVGLDLAHVVAPSWGGAVAIRLAATHPRRVERLVLAAPAGLPFGRSLAAVGAGMFRSGSPVRRDALGLMGVDLFRTGPLNLVRMAFDILHDDVAPLLSTVRAPTLILWGSRDDFVPMHIGERMIEGIPDARLHVMPAAGHNLMIDDPAGFVRAVVSFLSDVPSA